MRKDFGEVGHSDRSFRPKSVSLDLPDSIGPTLLETNETEMDRLLIKETKREMFKWVIRNLKSDSAKLLFKTWQSEAEKRGPDNVSLRKDIYSDWEKETGKSPSEMDREWKIIKKLIVRYLQEEEGLNLGPRTLKKMKVSTEVANTFWRRRFACWMLGICRARRVI